MGDDRFGGRDSQVDSERWKLQEDPVGWKKKRLKTAPFVHIHAQKAPPPLATTLAKPADLVVQTIEGFSYFAPSHLHFSS